MTQNDESCLPLDGVFVQFGLGYDPALSMSCRIRLHRWFNMMRVLPGSKAIMIHNGFGKRLDRTYFREVFTHVFDPASKKGEWCPHNIIPTSCKIFHTSNGTRLQEDFEAHNVYPKPFGSDNTLCFDPIEAALHFYKISNDQLMNNYDVETLDPEYHLKQDVRLHFHLLDQYSKKFSNADFCPLTKLLISNGTFAAGTVKGKDTFVHVGNNKTIWLCRSSNSLGLRREFFNVSFLDMLSKPHPSLLPEIYPFCFIPIDKNGQCVTQSLWRQIIRQCLDTILPPLSDIVSDYVMLLEWEYYFTQWKNRPLSKST